MKTRRWSPELEHRYRVWRIGDCSMCGREHVPLAGRDVNRGCGACQKKLWRGQAVYSARARRRYWRDIGNAFYKWHIMGGGYPPLLQSAYEAQRDGLKPRW